MKRKRRTPSFPGRGGRDAGGAIAPVSALPFGRAQAIAATRPEEASVLTVDFARLPIAPGVRVLDIGAGNGRHAYEALRRGALVTAADLDEQCLDEVASMAAAMELEGEVPTGAGLTIRRADACCLPFADASFDVVIAAEVLEHIPDDAGAVRELHRVVRPDGWIAVTVPRWWPERVCWALSRQYHEVEGGHVRVYRRASLANQLRSAGFEVASDHHHAHALHSPYWWLRCALGVDRPDALPARLYHRFLVYDLMRRPRWTRALEHALNPFLGKSVVLYARRPAGHVSTAAA